MTQLVTVDIYQPDGTTHISDVPRRQGVTWMNEANTPGTGQFVLHIDDPVLTAHPTLLAERNVVVFTRVSDGYVEKTWRIEAHTPVPIGPDEKAGRLTTVSGRGIIAGAEKALVWPYALAQPSGSDVRIFGYASPEALSAWTDPTLWAAPLGVRQDADPNRVGYPKPWRDPAAQWIAPTSPTGPAPIGPFWARGSFTLASAAEVLIEASGDNFLEVWLDGERIILGDPVDPYNWRQSYPFSRTEAAGTHVIAARVDNSGLHAGTTNPTGFLCTVYTCDASGVPTTNVLRSSPSSFVVTTTQPGWTIGGVLLKLFGEAQARGVTLLQGITFGFTKDHDSNGTAWALTDELPLTIGDDLGKVVDQSTELVCDIWMDGFVLNSAPRQGTDRHATVTLSDVLVSAPTFRAGGMVNAALIHFGAQWIEVTDPATIGTYRSEVSLQLGNVESATQASKMALAQFVETAAAEITIPVQTSSAKGVQPGVDYFLGDTVTGPGLFGESAHLRVMSITGTEGDGEIRYDNACYPEA